jgi:hypothetical protein
MAIKFSTSTPLHPISYPPISTPTLHPNPNPNFTKNHFNFVDDNALYLLDSRLAQEQIDTASAASVRTYPSLILQPAGYKHYLIPNSTLLLAQSTPLHR